MQSLQCVGTVEASQQYDQNVCEVLEDRGANFRLVLPLDEDMYWGRCCQFLLEKVDLPLKGCVLPLEGV